MTRSRGRGDCRASLAMTRSQGRGDCRASPFAMVRASAHRNDDSLEGEEKYDVILTTSVSRTIPGHSERVSAMEKPTGDDLRHQTAIFWFSILRVSTAIARAKMTFPDAAS